MSDSKSLVPKWVRGVTGLLAIPNIGYGVFGYVQPAAMFAKLDDAAVGALRPCINSTREMLALVWRS